MRLPYFALLAMPLLAQTTTTAVFEKKTMARLEMLDRTVDGVMGVAAIDLKTGHAFSYNGGMVTVQASLIKIPILVTVFHAGLNLDQTYTVTEKQSVGGSGTLDERLKQAPAVLTLRELLTLMIRDSDNTATNVVIGLVTQEKVNTLMAQLQLPNTRLRRVMMNGDAAKRDQENTSTPMEMARLVEMIYREKIAAPAACRQMMDLLKPIYKETAAYGHFGREGDGFTWEKTDKVSALKK